MALIIKKDAEQIYISGTPASTTIWEKIELGFNSGGMKIKVGGTGLLEWSWNGEDVHGSLTATDKEDFVNFHKGIIFIRGAAAAAAKIWLWI